RLAALARAAARFVRARGHIARRLGLAEQEKSVASRHEPAEGIGLAGGDERVREAVRRESARDRDRRERAFVEGGTDIENGTTALACDGCGERSAARRFRLSRVRRAEWAGHVR